MSFLILALLPDIAAARTYVVAGAGQTRCYNDRSQIIVPRPGQPFYGQDAQNRGVQPAYKDNSDGTITDPNTGLMWVTRDCLAVFS
jgi:hypothetical protein